ncbi:hypothetical protein ACQKJG_19000 [Priestia megaterium]|uniref:hypothetical protein n=1 Tax=Priestia megaterium TaxID=1404 RepID=UPI003D0824D2
MSLLAGTLKGLAKDGEILHDFTLADKKWVYKGLTSEEQATALSMVDPDYLKTKYNSDKLIPYNDVMNQLRTTALITMALKSIDGQSPVDTEKTGEEQFKQRRELYSELLALDSGMIEELRKEYNKLIKKQNDFWKDLAENVEK